MTQSRSFPEAPKEGETMTKQWQNKHHIWNTDARRKKNCNRETALEWAVEKLLRGLKQCYSHETLLFITKTRLFKNIEIFTTKKWNFSDKNSDIFHISAQNIDCGYSLEPPRRGGSNEYPQSIFLAEIRKIMYTPVNLSFTKYM